MNSLPKQNTEWSQNDTQEDFTVVQPETSHHETVEPISQPETSTNEKKGQRGRPKGIRSARVIQSEIAYKKSQVEKQLNRINKFNEDLNLAQSKVDTFEDEIAKLESQLETAE